MGSQPRDPGAAASPQQTVPPPGAPESASRPPSSFSSARLHHPTLQQSLPAQSFPHVASVYFEFASSSGMLLDRRHLPIALHAFALAGCCVAPCDKTWAPCACERTLCHPLCGNAECQQSFACVICQTQSCQTFVADDTHRRNICEMLVTVERKQPVRVFRSRVPATRVFKL
eukprot:2811921-Rhodomonas_salina.1